MTAAFPHTSTMTAVLLTANGAPLQTTSVDRPVAGVGQVLVRIRAAGLNPLDAKIRAGKAGHAQAQLPAVLGIDMAGVVEATGSGVSGFNATLWVGFMAPASTPKPIVDKLHDEITKILRRPDIKQAWEKTGATPIVMTQPEFKSFMDSQVAKWAEVIKTNHIAPIN